MPTLTWIFKTATGKTPEQWAENGCLEWYSAYADKREDAGKGILAADWNHFPKSAAEDSYRTEDGRKAQEYNWGKGRKFQDVLEHYGYQLEWLDQTTRCDHCYGCIHTDAQYHGDTSHYAYLGGDCGETVCEDCIRENFVEEYLETVSELNTRSAVNIRGIDPSKYGYLLVGRDYESGFHPGQTDDPAAVQRDLDARGYTGILFRITDSGQFDTHWEVYAKGVPRADRMAVLQAHFAQQEYANV